MAYARQGRKASEPWSTDPRRGAAYAGDRKRHAERQVLDRLPEGGISDQAPARNLARRVHPAMGVARRSPLTSFTAAIKLAGWLARSEPAGDRLHPARQRAVRRRGADLPGNRQAAGRPLLGYRRDSVRASGSLPDQRPRDVGAAGERDGGVSIIRRRGARLSGRCVTPDRVYSAALLTSFTFYLSMLPYEMFVH